MSAEKTVQYDGQKWDFENIGFKITRMALRFALPEGCQDCICAKSATNNLAERAVRDGLSVRHCVEELSSIFSNPPCEGLVEVEDNRDGCLPPFECGHPLGKTAVRSLWKSST